MCHGKTEVFPDKDGSDPYAVSSTDTETNLGLNKHSHYLSTESVTGASVLFTLVPDDGHMHCF